MMKRALAGCMMFARVAISSFPFSRPNNYQRQGFSLVFQSFFVRGCLFLLEYQPRNLLNALSLSLHPRIY